MFLNSGAILAEGHLQIPRQTDRTDITQTERQLKYPKRLKTIKKTDKQKHTEKEK